MLFHWTSRIFSFLTFGTFWNFQWRPPDHRKEFYSHVFNYQKAEQFFQSIRANFSSLTDVYSFKFSRRCVISDPSFTFFVIQDLSVKSSLNVDHLRIHHDESRTIVSEREHTYMISLQHSFEYWYSTWRLSRSSYGKQRDESSVRVFHIDKSVWFNKHSTHASVRNVNPFSSCWFLTFWVSWSCCITFCSSSSMTLIVLHVISMRICSWAWY